MDADCSGCCNIKLHNSHVTIAGGNQAGNVQLGGKAALTVRNTSLHGFSLALFGPAPDVAVTMVLSHCRNCSIDASILNATAIVNSEFSEPPFSEAVQGNLPSRNARFVIAKARVLMLKPAGGSAAARQASTRTPTTMARAVSTCAALR